MGRFLRRYGTLAGFVLILIFFSVRLPGTFMTAQNWLNITQQLSMLLVVAAGMTIVMVMGDFDLSVGSMASLSGVVVAVLFSFGWPIWAAVPAALLVGLVGGLINGAMVSLVGILPFVATLATLTIFSGAAFVVSGGRTISGRVIPDAFGEFARDGVPLGTFSVPNLTLVALAVLVEFVVAQPVASGGIARQVEVGRQLGALAAMADHAAVGAQPGQEAQRIDQQRLAGAGLAGDHGHARTELQFGGADDGEVLEGEVAEHGPVL